MEALASTTNLFFTNVTALMRTLLKEKYLWVWPLSTPSVYFDEVCHGRREHCAHTRKHICLPYRMIPTFVKDKSTLFYDRNLARQTFAKIWYHMVVKKISISQILQRLPIERMLCISIDVRGNIWRLRRKWRYYSKMNYFSIILCWKFWNCLTRDATQDMSPAYIQCTYSALWCILSGLKRIFLLSSFSALSCFLKEVRCVTVFNYSLITECFLFHHTTSLFEVYKNNQLQRTVFVI